MSMLTLNGTLSNIYVSPKGVNKTTGESFGGQHRLQVMCQNILQNGETRIDLVDLTIDEVEPYLSFIGKPVRVAVGVYVNAGKPAFYALKKQQATS